MIKLLSLALFTSLASCYSPASADPVGDTFTHAGNAIGNVVNSVAPPTTAPARYNTTYPAPVSGQLVR
ncbi:MAG: hypothetical protein ACSHX6_15365 [Akkermansiaceae bacterium]